MYGDYDLGFNTLYGAGQGVSETGDIMEQLFKLLQESGREHWQGFEWNPEDTGSWAWQGAYRPGGPSNYSPTSATALEQGGYRGAGTPGMDIQEWENYLSYGLGEGGYWEDTEGAGEGRGQSRKQAEDLLSLIKSIDIGGLSEGYESSVADMQTEYGSQLQNLQKGYTSKAKGSRYGRVGGGGRNVTGGNKQQYLSDIYGLQEGSAFAQQGLQEDFQSDFYDALSSWQTLNPSVA